MLGWDYATELLAPTSNVTVRNNLFVISKKDYGGTGYFLLIGSAPRNIHFDHNTIIHDGTTLVYAYTGTYFGRPTARSIPTAPSTASSGRTTCR